MANEVCSAMMLRQHQFVPSAEGDVAENVHVFVLYPRRDSGQGNSTLQTNWAAAGPSGERLRTAGVRARVVKAENGRPQPQISDSGWKERPRERTRWRTLTSTSTSTGCRLLPAGWKTVCQAHGREERAEWNDCTSGFCRLGDDDCPVAVA